MKYFIITLFSIILFNTTNLCSELLISEIAPATSTGDWVEIFYKSKNNKSLQISNLFVTMYYGKNEPLSNDLITIYSYNRKETPYDDRFVVVHLTDNQTPDETDLTGDTNQNGQIDVYCNNYYASLWNSDCIVAIDNNDNPEDGMIDFAAYSNFDNSPNTTILNYLKHATSTNQWISISSTTSQDSMIKIPEDGLISYQSINRIKMIDSNTNKDFSISNFQTPGQENIIQESKPFNNKIFKIVNKRIFFKKSKSSKQNPKCELKIYKPCNISLKVFNKQGIMVFKSKTYKDVQPGNFPINWNIHKGKKIRTSLYIALLEATDLKTKKVKRKKFVFIISRYK